MNYAEEVKRYEAELAEVNKRLNLLDEERTKLVRIGIRIEGVIAFLSSKIREAEASKQAAAPAESAEAKAEQPAAA